MVHRCNYGGATAKVVREVEAQIVGSIPAKFSFLTAKQPWVGEAKAVDALLDVAYHHRIVVLGHRF
ncbi:MAG: hypothetical protein DDT20_01481 [Firmicutes bacterium]|nr:hypothetical protein [Bacillota bacterium]